MENEDCDRGELTQGDTETAPALNVFPLQARKYEEEIMHEDAVKQQIAPEDSAEHPTKEQ